MRTAFSEVQRQLLADRKTNFEEFWKRNDVNGDGKVSLAELQ